MKQVLRLAERGRGYTRANPLVAARVLDRSGCLVGEGYHQRLGGEHAEVVALREAGPQARGGTLVVNLEPCCHKGRTGPCTKAVAKAGIQRVVIAHRDPDARVSGHGVALLREAGIEVIEGIEAERACRLNEHYLTYKRRGRPFVTVKLALTLDGYTADRRSESRWITGPACRRHAHGLRSGHDALVVGAETARRDDPQLTVRHVPGAQPDRFVMIGSRPLNPDLRLFRGDRPALRVGLKAACCDWPVDPDEHGRPSFSSFLTRLAETEHSSVMVEGGPHLAGSALRSGCVDKLVLYYGLRIVGDGRPAFAGWWELLADAPQLAHVAVDALEDGLVVTGYLEN